MIHWYCQFQQFLLQSLFVWQKTSSIINTGKIQVPELQQNIPSDILLVEYNLRAKLLKNINQLFTKCNEKYLSLWDTYLKTVYRVVQVEKHLDVLFLSAALSVGRTVVL